MSIDEVMLVAEDYSMAVHDGRDADCGRLHKKLRAAIEQHVAEEVAKEREDCAKACEDVATTQWDEYAASYNSAVFDCAAAIRTRAKKEME